MQKMHWCTAHLNLAGQGFTVLWFDATNAISWPEAQVLMAVHGEENIYDIKPIAISETTISDEKQRLALKYTNRPVEHVFPGRSFRMETLMPAETTELPLANEYGKIESMSVLVSPGGNGNPAPVEEPPAPRPAPADQPEDEDEEEGKAAAPPPTAVMSPGKHPRPHKGA